MSGQAGLTLDLDEDSGACQKWKNLSRRMAESVGSGHGSDASELQGHPSICTISILTDRECITYGIYIYERL